MSKMTFTNSPGNTVFILDDDGVVTYSWVADDSTNEPDYDDLIEAVEAA